MKRGLKITAIILAIVLVIGAIATALTYVFYSPFKKQVDDLFKKPQQEQTSAGTSYGTRLGILEDNLLDFEYRLSFAEEKEETNSEYFAKELTNLKSDFAVLKEQFEQDLGDIEEKLLRLENKITNLNNSLNLIFSKVSNPNLLINGDFRVNQRGENIYNTINKYTIDRWMLTGGTLTVNASSVTHSSDNANQGIRQYIEFPSVLSGRTVTASVEIQSDAGKSIIVAVCVNGSVKKMSGIIGDNTRKVVNLTLTLPTMTDDDYLSFEIYSESANTNFTSYFAKLETGEVATLYSPKTYSEELADCQRYYITNKNDFWIDIPAVTASNATQIYPQVNLPVSMRTLPTLVSWGSGTIRGNGQNLSINSVSIHGINSFGVRLMITTSGMTLYQSYAIHEIKIELDAEIY